MHSESIPSAPSNLPRAAGGARGAFGVIAGLGLLAGIIFLSASTPDHAGERLTRNLVRLSFSWYVVALCGMTRLGSADWTALSAAGRSVRGCWTWAAVCYFAHVIAAFHFFYHWSHHAAYEQTRLTSGIGQGLYVSYLFTAIWAVDVAWWWLRPTGYAARPKWIARGVHAFMAFMIFNGTVVYAAGPIRIAGILGFAAILAFWLVSLRRKTTAQAHATTPSATGSGTETKLARPGPEASVCP
jgi:hypothetical protein